MDSSSRPSEPVADHLRLGLAAGRAWGPEELRASLAYELDAPMAFDLGHLVEGDRRRLARLTAAQGLLLRSLRALFEHPHPPPELLRLAKDYAKSHSESPQGSPPREVALVLYYLCIAAASERCGTRLTQLTATELRAGYGWALDRPWLEGVARTLLARAREHLP
ncbi:MAG: hypothetical protein JXQ71_05850 [Verrucomicrobia bacterium]|nr:hypothetical protein [Verrucomicrobiota bacterium]